MPSSSRTSEACLLAMDQPCSITRLASSRPIPHSRCMHCTERGSRPGALIITLNIGVQTLVDMLALPLGGVGFQRFADRFATAKGIEVFLRRRRHDARGDEHDQLRAITAEAI